MKAALFPSSLGWVGGTGIDGDTVLDDLGRQAEGGSADAVVQLLAQARNGDEQ